MRLPSTITYRVKIRSLSPNLWSTRPRYWLTMIASRLLLARLSVLFWANAWASMLGYARNPPPGNGLVFFQVRMLFDTGLIRLGGMILLGNGVLLPGKRMARVTVGLGSLGYQRFSGRMISERSPWRIAKVGTVATLGVARRSRRPSKLNSQKVLSLIIGPESTPPNWFFRSSFFGCWGGRKYPRASSLSLRRNSNATPWS